MLQVDRERAWEALGEIETDLVLEVIEAYEERRLDMANASLLTHDLIDIRKELCRK